MTSPSSCSPSSLRLNAIVLRWCRKDGPVAVSNGMCGRGSSFVGGVGGAVGERRSEQSVVECVGAQLKSVLRRARVSLLGVKQASEEAAPMSWQGRRNPGDQQRQCMDEKTIIKRRIASVRIEGG